MKSKVLSILGILLALTVSSYARPGHGGGGGIAAAPVLQSVSVPMGAQTRSGRGSVRLSSVNVTTTANFPQTFYGLGMWVGGTPCATWTQTFVGGRSSTDYNIIAANTPEGANAQTPNPSSTGQNLATGTYTWNVTCKDSNGHLSNTVSLSYVTVAHAVNIGTLDRVDFGVTPSGFGNTTGGQVLLSVGSDFHAPVANGCCIGMRFDGAYANQVTIQYADPARPVYMTAIYTAGSLANYRATGFTLSGPVGNAGTNVISGFTAASGSTVSNIVWDNIHAEFSEALINNAANTSLGAFNSSGCTSNCGITDSSFNYIPTGANPGSNTYEKRVVYRHFYNNAFIMGSGNDIDLEDDTCMSPMLAPGGEHTDCMQVLDGATPIRVTIKRFSDLQADGGDQAQGVWFAGGLTGGVTPLDVYVDDGTTGHGPGNIATRTSGSFNTNSNGATIIIPGSITYANGITMSCANCNAANQVTLVGLSPTNIGSSASPVRMYGSGTMNDSTFDGIIDSQATFAAFSSNGEQGTNVFQDFSYVQQNATPPLVMTYQGSITTGGVLTVTTTPTTNLPTEAPVLENGGRLNYPGCNYCGPGIAGQLTGTANGIGTYTVGPQPGSTVTLQTLQNSGAYPITGGVWITQSFCNTPELHTGTFQIGPGYGQGTYFSRDGTTCPPANTNLVHFLGNSPNLPVAADYASGQTAQNYLQGLTWNNAVSNADVLTRNCLAIKGKIGGIFDGGTGHWWAAVTGETNAVTHTGGGNWTTSGGQDSGIAIPGCSAAP